MYVWVGGERGSGLECLCIYVDGRWCRLVCAEQTKPWSRVSQSLCIYVSCLTHGSLTYLDWSKLSKKDGRC